MPTTADATASAHLTAEADADGTGSRVEVPERVCARCEGAAKVCDVQADLYGGRYLDKGSIADECAQGIRSACLSARHAEGDAALIAEARADHVLDDYDADGAKWCRCCQADGDSLEWPCLPERLAVRLEGGKR